MQYALELTNVSKTYQGDGALEQKKALNSLNLKIPVGSIFGLLGSNGAGKSTAINIIAGLTNKSSGKVLIWGCDQDLSPEQSRSFIGVMPQELNLDPFLSAKDALEVQAGLFGVGKKERKTSHILEKVGLSDVANAYSRSLSGGMRRRLLMAKALVHSPPILILDEPTAGVDIELREVLWDYITELRDNGTTIVLTTHYLEEAQKICDQIGILSNGVLVEKGDTKDLLAKIDNKILIVHPGTEILKAPDFSPMVTSSLRIDGALQLSFDRSKISTEEVIDLCRKIGISIRDIATEEPALEDVFRLAIKNIH